MGNQTLTQAEAESACQREGWANAIACAKSSVKYNLPKELESPQFAQGFAATVGMPLDQALALSAQESGRGELRKLLAESAGRAAQKASTSQDGVEPSTPAAFQGGVDRWLGALGVAESKVFGEAAGSNRTQSASSAPSHVSGTGSQPGTHFGLQARSSTGTTRAPASRPMINLSRVPRSAELVEEGYLTESQSIFQVVSRRYFLKTGSTVPGR